MNKYLVLLTVLTEFEFYQNIFLKISNLKFHENLSFGSRDISRGQRDGLYN